MDVVTDFNFFGNNVSLFRHSKKFFRLLYACLSCGAILCFKVVKYISNRDGE